MDAYQAFFVTLYEVIGQPPAQMARQLRQYASNDLVNRMINLYEATLTDGHVPFGTAQFAPLEVKVDGDNATIIECRDGTTEGLRDAATGEVISTAHPFTRYVGSVVRVDGIWRLDDYSTEDGTCER